MRDLGFDPATFKNPGRQIDLAGIVGKMVGSKGDGLNAMLAAAATRGLPSVEIMHIAREDLAASCSRLLFAPKPTGRDDILSPPIIALWDAIIDRGCTPRFEKWVCPGGEFWALCGFDYTIFADLPK